VGGIWTRPGLDHQTRRLLVLATTAALGRWEEFRLHLGAGLDRDLEWSDVEEVLLQAGVSPVPLRTPASRSPPRNARRAG
jgi:3-oxoadipate enol-lactonase/4-carboxymuconolactone decarboxylase